MVVCLFPFSCFFDLDNVCAIGDNECGDVDVIVAVPRMYVHSYICTYAFTQLPRTLLSSGG